MNSGLESLRPTPSTRPVIPFGKYELLERINIGGMAEVVKARDTSRASAPIVAIKRILPHLTEDRQFVTMFLDESRVLARLEHDNIIRTLEVGQVGDTPYIALEYVWGQDARMLFHRARRSEQPIPIPVACYVIAQTCAALHYAHELADADGNLLGIVHRDVSLQNILVSYDGAVRLTDFGIAMSSENVARTEAGIVKGKFGYMSPEQIRGEPMDRRSDVFAIGICLYELTTSARLFSGETDYAAVQKVRNVVIDPPSHRNRQIPSALEAIVMRALAKHPRDRYQTAAELRRALLGFMAESRYESSDADVARHMRAAFATELQQHPAPESLIRTATPRHDEPTGLAVFDEIDQVSTVSAQSAVQPTPVEDHADSTVSPMPDRTHERGQRGEAAAGVDFDWDDEQLVTGTARTVVGQELAAIGAAAGDNDVTRQLYVGNMFSGPVGAGSEVRDAASVLGAPSPFGPATHAGDARDDPSQRTNSGSSRLSVQPRLSPSANTSYGLITAIVVAIVAFITLALFMTRPIQTARLHISTLPADAEVRLDGRRVAMRNSPFVVQGLAPGVEHRVEVSKSGFRGWSTKLSFRAGQVMQLPVIELSPEPEAAQPVPTTPEAAVLPKPAKRITGLASRSEAGHPHVPARTPEQTPKSESGQTRGATGVLRINSMPWSRVSIDGHAVGNTPQMNLKLSPGTHSVSLVNPEFKLKKTIKVRITADETLTKTIDLQ